MLSSLCMYECLESAEVCVILECTITFCSCRILKLSVSSCLAVGSFMHMRRKEAGLVTTKSTLGSAPVPRWMQIDM